MFRVIGKRPTMTPAGATRADQVMGHEIGELLIGAFVKYAPDGIVLEGPDNQYFETRRGELIDIDREDPGTLITAPQDPPADPSAKEINDYYRREAKRYLATRAIGQRYEG